MTDKKVLFDGSEDCTLRHVPFYLKNVAKVNLDGEKNVMALMWYLTGIISDFYFEKFAESAALSEDKKSYKLVKNVSREQIGPKKDPQK